MIPALGNSDVHLSSGATVNGRRDGWANWAGGVVILDRYGVQRQGEWCSRVWRRGEDLVDRRRGGGERDRLRDRDRGRFEDRMDRQAEFSERLDDRLERLEERLTRLEERAERLLGDRGRP